jgi:hypothetical protein
LHADALRRHICHFALSLDAGSDRPHAARVAQCAHSLCTMWPLAAGAAS